MTTPEVPAVPAAPPAPDPATPAAPAKPDTDFSSKFAALSKKERLYQINQRNFKAQREQFEKDRAAYAAEKAQWDTEWKENPLDAIKRRGVTYEDLTKAALNDGKFDPATEVKSVRDEIAQLKKDNEEKDRLAQEAAKTGAEQAEAQAVSDFKVNIGAHVDANKEKFELVAHFEAQELVFDTIEQHFTRTKDAGTPKVLSIEEACALTEAYLESEIERTATSSKKFQAKWGAKVKEEPKVPVKPPGTVTLSNSLTPSSPAAPSMTSKSVNDDRLKRAMAALG